jgi:ribosomal protein S18 acetylase RimI-like enzyme
MLPHELEAAVSVWRAANIARGAPHGAERTARIRAKLSASDALAFVALRPEIVGMALAEPGRLDDGAGGLDPTLLHISMVFVHPAAQETGVGSSLVLDVLDAARSLGYQRVNVWTYSDNTPARRLYEGVGMATTGQTARVLTRTQIQYGCLLSADVGKGESSQPVQ